MKIRSRSLNLGAAANIHLQDFMHELKLFPVLFAKVKVRITLPFEVGDFVTFIRQLSEMVQWLYMSLISISSRRALAHIPSSKARFDLGKHRVKPSMF